MNSVEIIPTIVPASAEDISAVSERYSAFASLFQIDIADGEFAPNTTWQIPETYVLPKEYQYEVHLMVADPIPAGDRFAKAGARRIIVHVEALTDPTAAKNAFAAWRAAGVESIGLALLFQTSFERLAPYLPFADFVLLMTIPRIGVQGIPYEPSAPARVAEFRAKYPSTAISVDGGVSAANIAHLARAGATHFGVGSAIAKAEDPAGEYKRLVSLAESVR